jgi:hypothetical protein
MVFKRLSREKLDLQNNDKYDQKKDPPIAAQTTKCTKHTVASLGQGDEGSENGMFEDPLYSPLASMAWTLPVRTDARASARTLLFYPQVTSKRTLQCVQVTDAPAAIIRLFVHPSENVCVTTFGLHTVFSMFHFS